jgi:sortase A
MKRSQQAFWTLSHALVLSGLYLLLFAGGLLADTQYNVYAASGATEVSSPAARGAESSSGTLPTVPPSPASADQPSFIPRDQEAPGRPVPAVADPERDHQTAEQPLTSDQRGSTITRIVIPAIKVDRKVLEVRWTLQQQDDQAVAVWEVDPYRVGHHQGSSSPGGGGNIVLSGHSGGWQYPFNDIYWLQVGDLIQLFSDGLVYDYRVSDHILVDEVGQPLEQRLQNARYIEPTDEEVVTMVACWPLTGPDKFSQRIIIRAEPAGTPYPASQGG